MKELKIETVENGFVVYEQSKHITNSPGVYSDKMHVFQTAQGLAEFIHDWGGKNIKHLPPISGPSLHTPKKAPYDTDQTNMNRDN